MREGRCISLIERLKQGSELKSTLSIGRYGLLSFNVFLCF